MIWYFVALVVAVVANVELGSANFYQHFGEEYTQFDAKSEPLLREWFVMFYAPWCGHCKRAKPAFLELQAALQNNLTATMEGLPEDEVEVLMGRLPQVGLVDCDENRFLCNYFSVQGFPTFLYFNRDRQVVRYKGPRNMENFLKFVQSHDPDNTTTAIRHPINTGWVNFIITLFSNHIFLFVLLFLVAPFLFGYFFMSVVDKPKTKPAEQKAQQTELKEKPQEQQKQEKQEKEEKQEAVQGKKDV